MTCVIDKTSFTTVQDIAINKLERRGLSNTAHPARQGKDVEVDAILVIEGGVYINYLAAATRQSASVIKVSGH